MILAAAEAGGLEGRCRPRTRGRRPAGPVRKIRPSAASNTRGAPAPRVRLAAAHGRFPGRGTETLASEVAEMLRAPKVQPKISKLAVAGLAERHLVLLARRQVVPQRSVRPAASAGRDSAGLSARSPAIAAAFLHGLSADAGLWRRLPSGRSRPSCSEVAWSPASAMALLAGCLVPVAGACCGGGPSMVICQCCGARRSPYETAGIPRRLRHG